MNLYGLKHAEVLEIKNLFQKFFGEIDDAKIFLFGSRSTGKHKPFSDIDVTIKTKSKKIHTQISLFLEGWEKSKLPYKIDITQWKEIYKPYLTQIKKESIPFWEPKEKAIHPWRICPYGKSWVKEHLRQPKNKHLQDVIGHCRMNPSKKDILEGDEIEFISKSLIFQSTLPIPCPYKGSEKILNANDYDVLIAGWCKYWNDIFKPDNPIEVNFVKALIESESRFRAETVVPNKKPIGAARGLVQLTEQTLRILKDKKGEIKDHYVILKKDELLDPSKNICAAIRWMFRKREILNRRLGRSPTWIETLAEYKGLGAQLKKNGDKATKIMSDFNKFLENYKC